MVNRPISPSDIVAAGSNYSHGIETQPGARWLHIMGQYPERPNGDVPDDLAEQCEVVFENLFAVLRAASMEPCDLVKLTQFLVQREDVPVFREVRARMLGEAAPATTLVIAGALIDPRWRLEVEGVAAKLDERSYEEEEDQGLATVS